jgi:predicted NUDIX family NTP pyrophosphohydrolase
MALISAGMMMYRRGPDGLQVLLVHPGGPFWKNKDDGAWTIPKGIVQPGEALLEAAQREFEEETGTAATGQFVSLGSIRQKGGKTVHAWAVQGELDPAAIRSNTFTMQWPLGSGRQVEFPEVDRAEFFDLEAARRKLNPAQVELIDRLEQLADSA